MQKFQSSKWLTSKPHVMVVSFLLAFVLWAVVVLSVNSTGTRTIDGVVVRIPSTGASFHALGLEIIDDGQTTYTASVTVSGDRAVIGALNEDSFTVTPVFTSVTQPGTYTLQLQATKTNQMQNFTIRSVNPAELSLTFAEVVTENFNVIPEVTGISVAEGYVLQPVTCTPGTIQISGAEASIERISKVVAVAAVDKELSESTTAYGNIHLLDEAGNLIPASNFRMDSSQIELLIPVYKEGDLPLEVGFINIPEGFDTSFLNYSLSPATIRVASTEENIDSLGKRTVGYIDLANYQLGDTYQFDIVLSTGYINVDSIETVTVAFDESNLSSKKITVEDIRLNNVPEGVEVNVATTAINGVTVIGRDVESLLPSGVVAEVDASTINIKQGSYSVPVSFQIPSRDDVWVAGTYMVTIEVGQG
ncbi:MAG: CdaR family protein [Oscillospiraceae bacterium]|nr:CdaR family protein [Oscillospiraceae bacterium]